MDPINPPVTYRGLFAVPGFRRVAAATVVARTGAAMQALVLVLFVLARFHSAPLAGVVVFLSIVPGLLISPVTGALLDRHRRMLLIGLDYAIAATVLTLITVLDVAGHLSAAALLLVVAVGSLTNPLSNSGTRSLFPVMVPRALWERANAVDSSGYVVASIAGPGIAGVLLGLVGAQGALLATAALYAMALFLLLGVGEPDVERMASGSLAGDALAGLRYVLHHRELRGIAVATAVSNIAFGIISVGMPVLVLSALHAGDAEVGAMYAVMGVAGLAASVLTGRIGSEDREVWFIVAGCVVGALGMLVMVVAAAVGGGLIVVAVAMALFGISQGPYDIGMFSLRQRVTAPAWMGRAFAVSMSLNFIGMPIGSVIAGPVVQHSIPVAFAVAVIVNVIAGVAAAVMLRPSHTGPANHGDGSDSGNPQVQPGTAVTVGG